MSKHSDRPEKWQRLLDAVKASERGDLVSDRQAAERPATEEFSTTLLGRLRAFHASLSSWKRWSLIAGLISILIFLASLIYLRSTSAHDQRPLIEVPRLDIPTPLPQNDQ
jgi:hypothetical protein